MALVAEGERKEEVIRMMGTVKYLLQTSVFNFVCVHFQGMGRGRHQINQVTMIKFATEAAGG